MFIVTTHAPCTCAVWICYALKNYVAEGISHSIVHVKELIEALYGLVTILCCQIMSFLSSSLVLRHARSSWLIGASKSFTFTVLYAEFVQIRKFLLKDHVNVMFAFPTFKIAIRFYQLMNKSIL